MHQSSSVASVGYDDAYQQKLARAILNGIRQYLAQQPIGARRTLG